MDVWVWLSLFSRVGNDMATCVGWVEVLPFGYLVGEMQFLRLGILGLLCKQAVRKKSDR